MKEENITYGEDLVRKFKNRGRSVGGYASIEDYKIWKQLKQDCIETNRGFYASGVSELLNIYSEMRKAVAPFLKNKEDVFDAIHEMAKNINVFESDTIEIKAIKNQEKEIRKEALKK